MARARKPLKGFVFRFTKENQALRLKLERAGLSRSEAQRRVFASERRIAERTIALSKSSPRSAGKKAGAALRGAIKSRVGAALDAYLLEVGVIAEGALDLLERETPRGDRPRRPAWTKPPMRRDADPRKHIADYWEVEPYGSSLASVGFEIKNTHPDADWLIDIFEFGSSPHTIEPRKPGGTLRFHWDAVGGIVNFKSVRHPGTKPLALIARAKAQIARETAALRASAPT